MPEKTIKKMLLRFSEAADMAGCGRTKAFAYGANGTWEVVDTPHGRRVVAASVERWIENMRDGSKS